MAFQVEELSIQLIEALAPLMPRIKQRDKALEDQLRRAASSIGLNCCGRELITLHRPFRGGWGTIQGGVAVCVLELNLRRI